MRRQRWICCVALMLFFVATSSTARAWSPRFPAPGVDKRVQYGETALMHAAVAADMPRMKRLLRLGANINARNDAGFTVLTLAMEPGRVKLIEFLLDRGAVVDFPDLLSGTPLICAVRMKDAPIVALLLRRGANVQALSPQDRQTPMQCALAMGDARIVRLLLAHGAALPAPGLRMDEALIVCARQNYPDVAKLLLEHGADVNTRSIQGMNALITAAKFGSAGIVSQLVARGANLNVYTSHGMSALTWAQARGHGDIVAILRRAGEAEGRRED